MTGKKATVAVKPKPTAPVLTDADLATAAKAAEWVAEQRKTRGKPIKLQTTFEGGQIAIEMAAEQQVTFDMFLQQSAGTLSRAFVDVLTLQIINMFGAASDETPKRLNAALAVLHSAKPANELEAMLIVDIIGLQHFTAHSLHYANKADMRDAREQYANMANKSARTITALVDSLARLRGGGQQKVTVIHEHRHVYVAAGGQAVVTDVLHTGGAGGVSNPGQSLAPPDFASLALAPGLPMRCADEGGNAMSGASREGSPSMQDARSVCRRAERQGKRALQNGAAHQGDEPTAGADPNVGEVGEGAHP